MANEYHLAILSKGVEFWNQWRKDNPDVMPDLREAHLEDEFLSKVNLDNANLVFAHLKNTKLLSAYLENADLRSANLEDACLCKANLRYANLIFAHLENADLRWACLDNAFLWDSDLENADLFDAKLHKTDLSQARNFILNNTYVYQTHFSPQARDHWSELRNSYTGIKSTLILFGSLLFFVPYIAKTLFLVAIHKTQYEFLPRVLEDVVKDDAAREQIKEAIANIPQYEYWVLSLLLGFNESFCLALLVIVLVAYNFFRLFLTYFVSPLREAEERSGYSPYYKDFHKYEMVAKDSIWIKTIKRFHSVWINMNHCYGWMIPIHRVLKFLFWVSVFTFFYNVYYWLFSTITVFDFNAMNNG